MFHRRLFRRDIFLPFCLGVTALVGCELPMTLQMAGTTLPGDVDGNGRVDIWDARSLDRSLTSRYFRVPFPDSADVSQNSELDRGDFEAIEKRAHGISTVEITINEDNLTPVVIGGVSSIVAADTFLPLDVKEGSVRITSQATNYDSGERKLYHVANGRSLVYHWNTSGLQPADDYVVAVQLKKVTRSAEPVPAKIQPSQEAPTLDAAPPVESSIGDGNAEPDTKSDRKNTGVVDATKLIAVSLPADGETVSSPVVPAALDETPPSPEYEISKHKLQISLTARAREMPVLAQVTDLSLPFWEMNLQLARQYCYSASAKQDVNEFGRGWTHAFGLRLVEHTDGLIEVRGLGPSALSFEKSDDGAYRKVTGGPERLVRDPDGSFQFFMDDDTVWSFDSSLNPVDVRDSQNHRITLHYENGHLVQMVDQAQQSLSLEYANDLVQSVTDSLGRTVRYQYDDDSNLVAAIGPAQEQSSYQYDKEHRLTRVLHQGTVLRSIAYHANGLVRSIEGGESVQLDYDTKTIGLGKRTIEATPGRVLHEDITPDGRVVARKVGAEGERVQFEYDDQFAVCKMSGPSNVVWSSTKNATENLARLTLPNGAEMLWSNLPEQHATLVTDANGISTTLRYLENGQLTHIQYPDGLVEVRRYLETEEGTSVKCELRSGQTVQYWFDHRGLLQAIQVNRQPKIVYEYDALGNLTSAANDWGTIVFDYDDRSRLLACTYPGGQTIRYEYDENGRRTSMTGPAGIQFAYRYDDRGRLTSVGQADGENLAVYTYGKLGNLASRKTSNHVAYNFDFTGAGQLKSIASVGPDDSSLSAWTYEYDTLGRKIGSSYNGQTQSYQYDSLGRLENVRVSGDAEQSIQYDSVGNRTSFNSDRFAANVLNQYSSAGEISRSYDLNGNLNARTQAGQKTAFEHDALNRLQRVRLPNQAVVSYQYDPLGRLATREVGGQVTRYYWDGDRIVYTESDAGSDPRTYVWGDKPGELISIYRDGKRYFCGQDGLGNIAEITDDMGQIVSRMQYDSFGNLLAEDTELGDISFRFAGSFYDPITELHCMTNRWYESSSGAFLEPQGLAAISGEHPYTFAASDPINRLNHSETGASLSEVVAGVYLVPTTARDLVASSLQQKRICRSIELPNVARVDLLQSSPQQLGVTPSSGPVSLLSQLGGLPLSR